MYRSLGIVSCLHNKKIRFILKSIMVPQNHSLKLKLNMETKWILSSCTLLWKNNQWNGAISKSVLNSPFTFFFSSRLLIFSCWLIRTYLFETVISCDSQHCNSKEDTTYDCLSKTKYHFTSKRGSYKNVSYTFYCNALKEYWRWLGVHMSDHPFLHIKARVQIFIWN